MGAGLRNFSSLHLARLTGGEITQLLAVLAPGLTKAVVARVARRADGVPLYAVEIARMALRAAGQDRRAASSDDVLPTSLHVPTVARIDGLGDVERSLLMEPRPRPTLHHGRWPRGRRGRSWMSGRSVEILLRQEMLTWDRWAHGSDWSARDSGAAGPRRIGLTLARAERQRRHLRAADYFESPDDESLPKWWAIGLWKAFQADPAHPQAAAIADRARPALCVLLLGPGAARAGSRPGAPERRPEHGRGRRRARGDPGRCGWAAQAAGSFEVAEGDLRLAGAAADHAR